jgi:hypothetical protein
MLRHETTEVALTPGRRFVAGAIVLLAVSGVVWSSAFRAALAILGAVTIAAWFWLERRFGRLARQRKGEDIGTFARAFDRRGKDFDPLVVRAVWDALQPHCRHRGGAVPLRPTDRFATLAMDLEEILDVAEEVSQRTGRSLGHPESSRIGRVETVKDLVEFFCALPTRPNHRLQPAATDAAVGRRG